MTAIDFEMHFLKSQVELMNGRMDRYVINKYNKMLMVKYRWVLTNMLLTLPAKSVEKRQ